MERGGKKRNETERNGKFRKGTESFATFRDRPEIRKSMRVNAFLVFRRESGFAEATPDKPRERRWAQTAQPAQLAATLNLWVAQLACQAVFGPRFEQHGLRANRATPARDWNRTEQSGTKRNETESFGKFRKETERNGTFRDGPEIRKSMRVNAFQVLSRESGFAEATPDKQRGRC